MKIHMYISNKLLLLFVKELWITKFHSLLLDRVSPTLQMGKLRCQTRQFSLTSRSNHSTSVASGHSVHPANPVSQWQHIAFTTLTRIYIPTNLCFCCFVLKFLCCRCGETILCVHVHNSLQTKFLQRFCKNCFATINEH